MRTRRQTPLIILVCAVLLIPFVGLRLLRWSRFPARRPANSIGGGVMADSATSFAVISTAFPNGAEVPRRHTCAGADLSPAFAWPRSGEATQSLALLRSE